MKNSNAFRFTYLLGFILMAALLGSAFFLQTYKGMSPCPLCLLQRMMMVALGTLFFVGAVVRLTRWGNLGLGFLGLLVGAGGVSLAGRQVWLQISPPGSSGDCGASLDYLWHVLSVKEAIKQVWQGGMECSQTGWEFFHLSLAAWSLIGFTILFLLVILQLIRAAID